jgi:hypothetical protein
MSKVKFSTYTARKISIATASVIIILVILDLLMTRQILPYGTTSASNIKKQKMVTIWYLQIEVNRNLL